MSADDFGFKVSMPGYDVNTATPEQCAVHSSYPPLKAKLEQSPAHFALLNIDFTATVAQGVTHTLYSFNHEYTYTPFVLPSMVFREPVIEFFSGVGEIAVGATLDILAYATATHFIVSIYDDNTWTNANASLEVSYYIFAEDGA
jgi:hypothetical protein